MESVMGKGIIKEIKRAHVKSWNSLCGVGKQTGLFRAQCKQAAESLLGAGTWTHGGYRRTWSFLEISAEQGRSEGGQQKHGTAVIEICISGNTGGRQFKEDSNNKESTKKAETQLKNKSKKPSSMKLFFTPFLRCQNLHWNKISFREEKRKRGNTYTCTS